MEFVDRRTLSRHNPIPPSQDTVTYPLRCGGNRRLAMVQQSSPTSIASRSPSRVPHREPQTTCAQKTLILYTASGYIDQQTKQFVRRGRNACLEELKKRRGVKISGSTLDRIVLKGKEAKGGVVCLERKKYDRSNKSHLTEEVKEGRKGIAKSKEPLPLAGLIKLFGGGAAPMPRAIAAAARESSLLQPRSSPPRRSAWGLAGLLRA